MCEKFFANHGYILTTLSRIIFGVLFMFHGLMKFGFLGNTPAPTFGLFWFAGAIEIVVGILVALGLLTRYAAMLGAVHMTMAWIIGHVPQGWNPFSNGGELAVLYFSAFLWIMTHGGGKLSVDAKLGLK